MKVYLLSALAGALLVIATVASIGIDLVLP